MGAEAMSEADEYVRGLVNAREVYEVRIRDFESQLAQRDAQCAAMREALEQRGCEEAHVDKSGAIWRCSSETPMDPCRTCRALSTDAGKAVLERVKAAEASIAQIEAIAEAQHGWTWERGCGDNSCRYRTEHKGMGTNGGCRCHENPKAAREIFRKLRMNIAQEREACAKVADREAEFTAGATFSVPPNEGAIETARAIAAAIRARKGET